jgi:hypothetical protein
MIAVRNPNRDSAPTMLVSVPPKSSIVRLPSAPQRAVLDSKSLPPRTLEAPLRMKFS